MTRWTEELAVGEEVTREALLLACDELDQGQADAGLSDEVEDGSTAKSRSRADFLESSRTGADGASSGTMRARRSERSGHGGPGNERRGGPDGCRRAARDQG